VLAVLAVIEWESPESICVLAGSALYLIGVVVVTIAFNVPRNDALAAADADSPAGAELWQRYLREWTAGNHVRTVAPLAAAALLTISLTT
jgi:uncharacterized membrane protein